STSSRSSAARGWASIGRRASSRNLPPASSSRRCARRSSPIHEDRLMKAWEIQNGFGLANLKLAERPDPRPGPGQVLIRVRAVSLNYRDLLTVEGKYNPKQKLPLVPCSDGAGEVVAVGEGVTRVKPGDRVCGIFAQRWIAGEPNRERLRSTLGGPLDGMLAELVVLPEEGVVAV